MKTVIKKQFTSLVAIIATVFGITSCIDNKFNFPIEELYDHGLTANINIAELKAKYLNSTVEITQDLIVEGYVCSSDKEGNIFKTLYIQDETGGLPIVIDQSNINNNYRVGRKVLVKLKGLHLGAYSGLIQLGLMPETGETSPSRIPATVVSNYIVKDKDVAAIQPEEVTISQLASRDDLIGKLIKINDVQFSTPDATYATADANTNRTVEDRDGNTIIMRNSSYSTFALIPLPQGSGTLTAVLSVFVSGATKTYQLLIRDTADVAFNNPRFGGGSGTGTGDGSENNPYNVASGITNQGLDDTVWAQGYIVGCVKNGVTSVLSATDIAFGSGWDSQTNVLIADSPDETNYTKCIVVNLPSGKPLRTQVNLVTHPENYKKLLKVRGKLRTYFSLAGLRDSPGETSDFVLEGQGGGTGTGNGSENNPYNVADGITNQGLNDTVWTQGYIVGCVKNGVSSVTSAADIVFGSGWDSQTNVLIADSPDETDYTKCIAVNLPSGKPLRTQVNLVTHPENYKKSLKVRGKLRAYFALAGLRDSPGETSDFVLEGQGGGGTGGNDIFNETLLTQTSFDKFTKVSLSGNQGWTFDAQYGAVMSGYVNADTRSYANVDWFISPAVDLSAYTAAKVVFNHARGPAASITVGVSQGWYKVYVSNNYSSGDPTAATWTELTGVTHGTAAWAYVSSGELNIPAANLAANCRIAFRYECSDTESATWEINNVVVKE
ncbi:MAG: DUF5689 domain-containing protein [Prevotellaceae bacterium]|nr:DUF5689 domain-containing protein [Prevotellaceae bacterium]